MRNNEKNSIELHAFCTQFYPPTLSNFTCMHEYPPLPKKKKKNFPQSIHHSTPILFHTKYTRKKYPSSSTIFWTTQFSICHLSPPQIHSTHCTYPPFSFIPRTRGGVHTVSSIPSQDLVWSRESIIQAKPPPRSNIFHPRFFQSKSNEKSEKGRELGCRLPDLHFRPLNIRLIGCWSFTEIFPKGSSLGRGVEKVLESFPKF